MDVRQLKSPNGTSSSRLLDFGLGYGTRRNEREQDGQPNGLAVYPSPFLGDVVFVSVFRRCKSMSNQTIQAGNSKGQEEIYALAIGS